jgi:UDP:flavonoid glycosyltransferase YjiC (YdhE family)
VKIGVQTWGSEGDVRPFIALAAGLASAGHETTLFYSEITDKDFLRFARKPGFDMKRVGTLGDGLALLRRHGEDILFTRDPLLQVRKIIRYFFNPLADDLLDGARTLCRENDLVIGHFLVHPLALAAEEAGRPRISVFTAPAHPSRHYMAGGGPDLGPLMNRFLWIIGEFLINRFFAPEINRLRRREGLGPIRRVIREVWASPILNLVEVSPTLFPRPLDWPSHVQVPGFFNIPQENDTWEMDIALERFLGAGPPPIFITFGSLTAAERQPNPIIGLLVEAVTRAGCRGILQFERPAAMEIDATRIHFIGPVPHRRIFPRCAAVVHHGGSGTTQTATLAGRPSVVVAHATDQTFWGALLHRAGIAPRSLHRRSLTAPKLTGAIQTVLSTPEMAEKAGAIGHRMAMEDGVWEAVRRIEAEITPGPRDTRAGRSLH